MHFIDTWLVISSPNPLLTYHREYMTTFMDTGLGPSQTSSLVDTVSYGPHNEGEGFDPYIFIVDVERARPTLIHHHIPWTLSTPNNQLSSTIIHHHHCSFNLIQKIDFHASILEISLFIKMDVSSTWLAWASKRWHQICPYSPVIFPLF